MLPDGNGPVLMRSAVQQAKQKCPNTKIFVGGYSQGCEVVHYASKHGGNFAQDVVGAVSTLLIRSNLTLD